MEKFRFYQDIKVTSYVRDYYDVKAESLQEAIELVKQSNMTMDELENENENVSWYMCDRDILHQCIEETNSYSIFSVDLEDETGDGEIVTK